MYRIQSLRDAASIALLLLVFPSCATETREPSTERTRFSLESGEPWPFDQSPTTAAISTRAILSGDAPILRVFHDLDDHGWQFLDGGPVDEASAALVGMGRIVELDPTVLEVAHIPPGSVAWRESVGAAWQIEEQAR
jgi:hypothetical protein